MSRYMVVMRADVWIEVDVDADSEEEAKYAAYDALGDADYEVDFVPESVYEIVPG